MSAKQIQTDMRWQFATRNVRVMITATTIEQAVNPLLLIYSVLGIGVAGKLYLSIFYNLTIWIAYGCLYYYSVAALEAGIWFQLVSNAVHIGILATIISAITGVYQDKRFRIFTQRLAAIDDTLEELGTSKLYQKMHTCTKRVVAEWLVCSHMANVLDMLWWLYAMENRWCIILPYITNHYHHVNMFVEMLFMTFLWHLHLKLCQIACELNTMFGSHVTIEMIAYLINLIRLGHFILKNIQIKNYYILSINSWLGVYFWISIYVARLFYFNYVCENVSAKANEMKRIIHQLSDTLRYTDVRNELYQFAQTIIRHPLKFIGLGLFYFGNGFLRKFFITVTTFLIIIMQMSA